MQEYMSKTDRIQGCIREFLADEKKHSTKNADFFIIYLRIIKNAYKKRAGFLRLLFFNADIKT